MPKVIEKLREDLIREVRRSLEEDGYGKITMRTIASACGVGVGTVYNYFSSKDELVASVVWEDWKETVEAFKKKTFLSDKEIVRGVYDMLKSFIKEHEMLFSDPDAGKKYSSVFGERHSIMRKEVSSLLLPVCEDKEDGDFLSLFLAESLLSWIMTDVSFEKIYSILGKII